MSVTSAFSMFRGEDVTLTFTFSTVPSGGISGWTLTWKMAEYQGGDILLTKTATVTNASSGIFTVSLASADTSSLDCQTYYWDCRRTDSGSKATVADGTLELKREITA